MTSDPGVRPAGRSWAGRPAALLLAVLASAAASAAPLVWPGPGLPTGLLIATDAPSCTVSAVARPGASNAVVLAAFGPASVAGTAAPGKGQGTAPVAEEAHGPGWKFVAFSPSGPGGDGVRSRRREVLHVEPDLFVVRDHVDLASPGRVELEARVPADSKLDPTWGDLRVEGPEQGLTVVGLVSGDRVLPWQRQEAGTLAAGTAAFRIASPRPAESADLLSVMVVHRAGSRQDVAVKPLSSSTAVGLRIYRGGVPTLVAFRRRPDVVDAGVVGFRFDGPVGVSGLKAAR